MHIGALKDRKRAVGRGRREQRVDERRGAPITGDYLSTHKGRSTRAEEEGDQVVEKVESRGKNERKRKKRVRKGEDTHGVIG